MASVFSLTLNVGASFSVSEAIDLSTVYNSGGKTYTQTVADGTGASQAKQVFSDTRTLAASGNDDLDLTALTVSAIGNTMTTNLTQLKGILIVNKSTTSGDKLRIDTSVTNGLQALTEAASGKIKIPPSGHLLISDPVDGMTVDSTHKIVRINNPSAHSIDYDIIVWGV
jgi:hypothetical protein